MFESKSKNKDRGFQEPYIEFLRQNSFDRIVNGFQDTEKESLKQFMTDTSNLIEHNEYGLGWKIC